MAVITGTVGSITISTAAAGGGGGGGLSFGGGAALFFGIYSSPTGGMIADLSGRVQGVTVSTNIHGFADLSAFCPMSLEDAFFLYDQAGTPHVIVSERGAVIWEGRLEDVAIVNGGVRLKAFGYQRALSDVPYTAVWSCGEVSEYKPITKDALSSRNESLYRFDTNNRLRIEITKGASYGTGTDVGALYYETPDNGARNIAYVTATYAYNLPTNWIARAYGHDTAWANAVTTDIASSGGSGTGILSWNISASTRQRVSFGIFNNTGSTSVSASESGTYYLTISSPRLMTSGGSTVYGENIAAALVSFVSAINSSQLNSSSDLINSQGVDLSNETYIEQTPADILTRLAGLGDTAGNVWEWGVYEGQLLHFRARGASGRSWYVDAASVEVERTIDTLANSVYAVYRDGDGRTRRTSTSADSPSVDAYGLTRRKAVSTDATNSTQAGYIRDVSLSDGKDPSPRIGITFRELYDAAGGRWPLWYARSGDTITIRNLPPTISTSIDRIRTFRISETSYNADSDTLNVTPETPLPALDVFVARKAAGL